MIAPRGRGPGDVANLVAFAILAQAIKFAAQCRAGGDGASPFPPGGCELDREYAAWLLRYLAARRRLARFPRRPSVRRGASSFDSAQTCGRARHRRARPGRIGYRACATLPARTQEFNRSAGSMRKLRGVSSTIARANRDAPEISNFDRDRNWHGERRANIARCGAVRVGWARGSRSKSQSHAAKQ